MSKAHRRPTIFSAGLLLANFLLMLHANAESKKVILDAYDFPPYLGVDLQNKGIAAQIATEAYARVGYHAEIRFVPFARALEECKSGAVDGILMVWNSGNRGTYLAFSDPLPPNDYGIYKLKSTPIKSSSYADLKPFKIGIVIGYALPPGFADANLNTEAVTLDELNFRKMLAGRIDGMLVEKQVAQFLIESKFKESEHKLEWVGPPLQTLIPYLGISKNTPESSKKLTDFNEGLKQMSAEGRVMAILTDFFNPTAVNSLK